MWLLLPVYVQGYWKRMKVIDIYIHGLQDFNPNQQKSNATVSLIYESTDTLFLSHCCSVIVFKWTD